MVSGNYAGNPNEPSTGDFMVDAWYRASAANKTEAEKYLLYLEAQHMVQNQRSQAETQAEIDYLTGVAQANNLEASANASATALQGSAYVSFLIEKGKVLLASLQTQEGNALSAFVDQAIYDLTPVREIHGENARPGYSGVRRFGAEPTEEQVKQLPGYAALQKQFQNQIDEFTKLNENEVGLARQNESAGNMRAAGSSSATAMRGNAAIERAIAEGKAREDFFRQQYYLERGKVQEQIDAQNARNQFYVEGQSSSGIPGSPGWQPAPSYPQGTSDQNAPNLNGGTGDMTTGYGGQVDNSYYGSNFARGGVTRAARDAAIKRRLNRRG